MNVRLLTSAVVLSALMTTSLSAKAAVISGTFAGVANGGSFTNSSGELVNVNGSAVTGTFDVSSVAGATVLPGAAPGNFLLAAGAISYSFFIAALDQTISFGTPPNLVGPAYLELTDNGSTQTALLDEALVDPNSGTALTLTGPEGSLFSSVDDVGSLHTGAGVTLGSPIVVGERFEGMTTVNLTNQTISVTGQAIPEPAGWTFLAVCLAALVGVRATFGRQHKDIIATG